MNKGFDLGPFSYLHPVKDGNYEWIEDVVPTSFLGPNILPSDTGSGFTIVRQHILEPWLIEPNIGQELRLYSPLTEPGLFERFVRLKPEQKAIRRFVMQYGFLGHRKMLINPTLKEQQPRWGESLSFWNHNIQHLATLDKVWKLVKKADETELRAYISWQERGERKPYCVSFAPPSGGFNLIASDHIKPDLLTQWTFGDVIGPASFFVCTEINTILAGHVSPAVLPFRERKIMMVPNCLLSALYVLFALEVSGRRHPDKKCKGCEKYFQPARANQVYHNGKCRKLHYWHESPKSPKNREQDETN